MLKYPRLILSIITINYNNASGLEKTIESVLQQTFTNYEWIVIDGGSNDGSVDILRKYSDRFSYWESEPDKGIYHAQNKGILKAKGDYCFFLNSGDYLVSKNVLENIFKSCPGEDVLFGNLYVTIRGKIIGKTYGKERLTFSDIYAHAIKHQASFIRRSLFERFGFFNETYKVISDWEFMIKTVGLGNASYRYHDVFICYFDNDGLSNHIPDIVRLERDEVVNQNIPAMMQPDYEYLLKYRLYGKIFRNRFCFFLIRLLNKMLPGK